MSMDREALAEEFEFFQWFGYTPEQIADRFGMKYDSMARSLLRQGAPIVRQEDWQTHQVLERLIASGQEFSTDHLPDQSGGAQRMMNRALAQGRIVKVGHRNGLFMRKKVGVYKAVQ